MNRALVLLSFFIAAAPGISSAETAPVQSPAAASPAANVLAAPGGPNRILLLDDFERGGLLNRLGGHTQGDEEYPGGCIPSFVEKAEAFGGSGASLKLDYDVTIPNSFSYYWSKTGPPDVAPGTSAPLDLSEYRYISLWIKSPDAAPRFGVEIHQDSDDDGLFVLGKDLVGKVLVTKYLRSEETEVWRKVVIPLAHFSQIKDWSKVLEVVLVFENSNRSKKGSLLVDDLLFGTSDPEESSVPPIEKEKIFGYLKNNGGDFGSSEWKLIIANNLELFLNSLPPQLERVRFDVSSDQGESWETLQNFYKHQDGRYTYLWKQKEADPEKELWLRAVASDIYGAETILIEPVIELEETETEDA